MRKEQLLEIIQTPWENKLLWKIREVEKELFLVCPYIKRRIALIIGALPPFAELPLHLKILTRFDLNDFLSGASDFEAIELFLTSTEKRLIKEMRFINNLHSKLFFFDGKESIITSSNLTTPGLNDNIEIGISIFDKELTESLLNLVNQYWQIAKVLDKDILSSAEKLLFYSDITESKKNISKSKKEILEASINIDSSLSELLLDKARRIPLGVDEEDIGVEVRRIKSDRKRIKRQGIKAIKIVEARIAQKEPEPELAETLANEVITPEEIVEDKARKDIFAYPAIEHILETFRKSHDNTKLERFKDVLRTASEKGSATSDELLYALPLEELSVLDLDELFDTLDEMGIQVVDKEIISKKKYEEVKKSLKVGDIIKCYVKRIDKSDYPFTLGSQFGKFFGRYKVVVDIQGVEGIIIQNRTPYDLFAVDESIDAVVMVNRDDNLILNSVENYRRLEELKKKYPLGTKISGTVKSITIY